MIGVANLGSHVGDHDIGAKMGYSLLCILQLTNRFCQKQRTERKHTFSFNP